MSPAAIVAGGIARAIAASPAVLPRDVDGADRCAAHDSAVDAAVG